MSLHAKSEEIPKKAIVVVGMWFGGLASQLKAPGGEPRAFRRSRARAMGAQAGAALVCTYVGWCGASGEASRAGGVHLAGCATPVNGGSEGIAVTKRFPLEGLHRTVTRSCNVPLTYLCRTLLIRV
jgi:hypothetical protein